MSEKSSYDLYTGRPSSNRLGAFTGTNSGASRFRFFFFCPGSNTRSFSFGGRAASASAASAARFASVRALAFFPALNSASRSKSPGGGEESAGFAAGPRAAEGADAVTGARGGWARVSYPSSDARVAPGSNTGAGAVGSAAAVGSRFELLWSPPPPTTTAASATLSQIPPRRRDDSRSFVATSPALALSCPLISEAPHSPRASRLRPRLAPSLTARRLTRNPRRR